MKKTVTPNIHRYNPPKWFRDADFGIFIHWGASSIPAFAPVDVDDYGTLMKEKPMSYVFANMPYAEWYPNSMKFPGSPAQLYHEKTSRTRLMTILSKNLKNMQRMWMWKMGRTV